MGNIEIIPEKKIENNIQILEKHITDPYDDDNDIFVGMYLNNTELTGAIYILNLKKNNILEVKFTIQKQNVYVPMEKLYQDLNAGLIKMIMKKKIFIDYNDTFGEPLYEKNNEKNNALSITMGTSENGYFVVTYTGLLIPVKEQFKKITIDKIPSSIAHIYINRLNMVPNFIRKSI